MKFLKIMIFLKTALDLRDRSKKKFTFVKNRPKNDICYLNFEIFEKIEYLYDHEQLDIGNGTVIFSYDPLSVKLTIFKI